MVTAVLVVALVALISTSLTALIVIAMVVEQLAQFPSFPGMQFSQIFLPLGQTKLICCCLNLPVVVLGQREKIK